MSTNHRKSIATHTRKRSAICCRSQTSFTRQMKSERRGCKTVLNRSNHEPIAMEAEVVEDSGVEIEVVVVVVGEGEGMLGLEDAGLDIGDEGV